MLELMRAAVYDRYGPPEVLAVAEVPRPQAGAGMVLVKVAATSVNGGELLARAGRARVVTALDPGFPKRIGLDFAGTVDAVGDDVALYQPGDVVWGMVRRRLETAAEYVAIRSDQLALAPTGLDPAVAAALPAVGTTAVTALVDKAQVRRGERVLIRGAAGGVGSIAVQLAHSVGAHVTALASARAADVVRSLGADTVADYRDVDVEALGTFDVILDAVGTDLERFRRLLSTGGRMVTITLDQQRMLATLVHIAGSARHGTRRVRFFSGQPRHPLFRRLTALVDDGTVRPLVHASYPLEQIAAAHARLEQGGINGKITVTV